MSGFTMSTAPSPSCTGACPDARDTAPRTLDAWPLRTPALLQGFVTVHDPEVRRTLRLHRMVLLMARGGHLFLSTPVDDGDVLGAQQL